MPTQNVNISEQQAAFIQASIAAGQFCNASEVMRAGLRALEQKMREDELKLKNLRRLVAEGDKDFENGRYVAIEYNQIDAFLDKL